MAAGLTRKRRAFYLFTYLTHWSAVRKSAIICILRLFLEFNSMNVSVVQFTSESFSCDPLSLG